jgi:iron-sulfur cluster assembly protein
MESRRKKKSIITLTDAAAQHIQSIIEDYDGDAPLLGVKVGLRKAGCAGMAYTMDYVSETNALDEVVQDKGVTLYIDSKALMFLLGMEMDYAEDKLSSGFKFHNPNQTAACGCGESVKLEAVMLENQENAK